MVLNNATKLMLGDREAIARYQGDKQVWTAEKPTVYGWHVDPSISDPAQAVTYLADAVGKTPAAMGASSFDYGDWTDAFFMPKPCMLRYDGTVAYYLDPNDYTKKANTTISIEIEQGGVGNVTSGGFPYKLPESENPDLYGKRLRTANYYELKPNTTYTIGATNNSKNLTISVAQLSSNGEYVYANSLAALPYTFTTEATTTQMLFVLYDNNNSVTPADIDGVYYSEKTDVANASFDGNAMMEWPLIWYKFEAGAAEGEGYFYCSDQQVDSSYKCWCNINSQNEVTEHFYTAIYNGTGTSKLRSISGVQLTQANGSANTTGQQELDRALANNTSNTIEWYTETWSDRVLISALLILISKSLNNQAAFGNGLVDGSQTAKDAYVTGALNDKGLFWGSLSSDASGVKVFGMENFYGCIWRRIAGLIGTLAGSAYKLTYGTADGSTATGYNSTGTGYLTVSGKPNAHGNVKTMNFGFYGFLPETVGGNETDYWSEYFYTGSSGYAIVGGASYGKTKNGASDIALDYDYSVTNSLISTVLSCKPVAKEEST